jgi:hypothetical protein
LASPFADQLAMIYPNAKVVVVQRDFESWWPSYKTECLDSVFTPIQQLVIFLLWHVLGIRAGYAIMKVHLGFFQAKSRAEIELNARQGYERYSSHKPFSVRSPIRYHNLLISLGTLRKFEKLFLPKDY